MASKGLQIEMSPLEKLLKERILKEGPLTYEAFLETVLYDEHLGYYRSGKRDRQDYYTSPEIHNLFGKALAAYIENYCDRLGVRTVTVLELGGASGRLAADIIAFLTHLDVKRYYILERGIERQEGVIRWVNSLDRIDAAEEITFILANEFFDALPFHKITSHSGVLQEIYVDYSDGFSERTAPLSRPLKEFLDRHPAFLRDDQVSEATICAAPLLERISGAVKRACFLVFDYGYHQTEIVGGRFPDGSVVGYRTWQIRDDLFENLGRTDITHHVNFDHLSAMLVDHGWTKEGEIEQYRFLCNVGMLEILAGLSPEERLTAKWLINPEGLGSMISVLGYSKGLPFSLPGFRRG